MQNIDDAAWTPVIGGLHLASDVSVADDGELWAAGSAIARYDNERGLWHVTDWARGYAAESLEIGEDGNGWAILNPSQSEGESPPPGVPTAGLAELREGKIVYIEPFADVWWTDIALTPSGDFIAVGFNTEPVFMQLTPGGAGWLPMPFAEDATRGAERIFAVTMLSATAGYAISSPGALWEWDGVVWSLLSWAPLESGMGVWDVAATSASNLWVVGGEAGSGQFAATFDGQEWRVLRSTREAPAFLSIALAGPGDGWIVGTFGGVHRLMDDEITEVTRTWPEGIWAGLRSVEYAAPGVAIAAGDYGQVVTASDGGGVVFHTEWSGPGMFFSGLIASDGSVWLGGAQCPGTLCGNEEDTWLAQVYSLRDGVPARDKLPELTGGMTALVEHEGDLYGIVSAAKGTSDSPTDKGFLLRRDNGEWGVLAEIDEWYPEHAVSLPGVGLLVLTKQSVGQLPLDSAVRLYTSAGELLDSWEFEGTDLHDVSVLEDYGVFAAGRQYLESENRAIVLRLEGSEWIASYPKGSVATCVVGASGFGLWVFVSESGTASTAYQMEDEVFDHPVDIVGNDGMFTRGVVLPTGLFVGSDNGSVIKYDGERWTRVFALSNQQWSYKSGNALFGRENELIFVGEPAFVIQMGKETPMPDSTETPTIVATATPTNDARGQLFLPAAFK